MKLNFWPLSSIFPHKTKMIQYWGGRRKNICSCVCKGNKWGAGGRRCCGRKEKQLMKNITSRAGNTPLLPTLLWESGWRCLKSMKPEGTVYSRDCNLRWNYSLNWWTFGVILLVTIQIQMTLSLLIFFALFLPVQQKMVKQFHWGMVGH